jgi:uncharacterized protein (TIGR03083 family)
LLTTSEQMFDAITAQRIALADRLDNLSPNAWDQSSLCAGWRVRDVVAHLVSILEIPIGTFLWKSATSGGFNKFADKSARHIGGRPPADLVAALRSNASKRFAPPFVGPIAPLTDILVHTRDIERPLGHASLLDEAALATSLNYVCGGKARGFVPSKRTRGLRFEATDVAWSIGSGPVVRGSGEAILMATTGRRPAVVDLSGDGLGSFSERLNG